MAASAPADWSLFDHIAFLLGRWPLLLAGTLVCGGLAYGIGSVLTTRSAADGLLRIGSAYFVGPLAKPSDVAARMSSVAFLGAVVHDAPQAFPAGTSGLGLTATATDGSSLVHVRATAPTPKEAAALVRFATQRVVTDHARAYRRVQAVIKTELVHISKEITLAESALARVPKDGDPTARVFAESRRDLVFERLAKLRSQRVQDELRIDPEVTQPTALVDGPVTRTVSARRKATVVGAVGGFVVAAFLAYFLAWRRRVA